MRNQSVRVRRTQFLIVSAEAITIAKSQGQTYESVVVTINRKMQRSELYVALSRARTSAGLFIIGEFFQPRVTPTVQLVAEELQRLRINAAIDFRLSFLNDKHSSGLNVMVHNVQSLNKHIMDITSDPNYMAADVLCLTETWTIPNDRFNLPGFSLLYQTEAETQRRPSGCSVYAKVSVAVIKEFIFRDTDISQHIEAIAFSVLDTAIVVIYNSPKSTLKNLMACVGEIMGHLKSYKRIIVAGDFNININSHRESQPFMNQMTAFGLALINTIGESSTNGHTQIDLLFSSDQYIQIKWYESYFSYHKPFFFSVPCSMNFENLKIK